MVTAVQNGINGYVDTNVATLVDHMQRLLEDPSEAAELSKGARHIARERFGIGRFVRDWDAAFRFVAGQPSWTGYTTENGGEVASSVATMGARP